MPDLNLYGKYATSTGCGPSHIDRMVQWEEQETGKSADRIAISRKCYAEAEAKAEAQRMEIQAEQFHNRLVAGGIGSAALVVVVLVVIFRKPIRMALEGVFVSSAAKAIVSKRELEEYGKSIKERIRNETDKSPTPTDGQ